MKWLVAVLMLIAAPVFGDMPYDAVGKVEIGNGHGSGTLVARSLDGTKGLVITAGHVVATVAECKVRWGNEVRTAKVVKTVKDCDLAILVVDRPPVKAVGYARVTGRMIVVTGYPWWNKSKLCWQVGVTGDMMEHNFMKVTCKPEPGLSGGACFDWSGKLIAVVSGHDRNWGYLGYKVKPLLDEYQDPKTWVPSTDHIEVPENYGPSARPEKPYRTIPYNEHTAPKLPL